MPLSEHEQKMLEQMERALYAEDPKFATQMKGRARAGLSRSRLLLSVAIAVVGLGVVVLGVSTQLPLLGALGFAVMVGGVAWALTPRRHLGVVGGKKGAKPTPKAGPAQKPNSSGTFMERLEQRWEKRQGDDRW